MIEISSIQAIEAISIIYLQAHAFINQICYQSFTFQGLTESEATLWNLFSTYLGSSCDSSQSLLDLAELETVDEVSGDLLEDINEETVDMVQWLHDIQPVKR